MEAAFRRMHGGTPEKEGVRKGNLPGQSPERLEPWFVLRRTRYRKSRFPGIGRTVRLFEDLKKCKKCGGQQQVWRSRLPAQNSGRKPVDTIGPRQELAAAGKQPLVRQRVQFLAGNGRNF